MMILICAATDIELRPLLQLLELHQTAHPQEDLRWNIVVTGPGILNTTFHLTDHLNKTQYDLAVNLGLCGSYFPEYKIGDVVRVHKDRFADWGSSERHGFVDVFEMGLENPDKFPYDSGWIYETVHPALPSTTIPNVEAFTVNTIRESGMELIQQKNRADVESMEGAAFFYVCKQFNIPCLQLRAVSNMVGERDHSRWGIQEACANLSEYFVYKVLNKIRLTL